MLKNYEYTTDNSSEIFQDYFRTHQKMKKATRLS